MHEAALEAFRPAIDVCYDPTLVDDTELLHRELAQADALIVRNRTRVDLSLPDAAPDLRVIGRLGVGLENIDLEACAERGVSVKPATGANTQSVVECVIGAMLVLRRGVFASTPEVLADDWRRHWQSLGTILRASIVHDDHCADADHIFLILSAASEAYILPMRSNACT
ncbi:hypothetical protein [uncultured Roseibium sp.]|uniref:hypothetical protein n=1 Tax=uncultured Roseibium sp. TaxID=1936171 RepID=UPI00261F3C0F|nr:hypothetical protein [uncultured Roseibium sp.]